MSGEMISEDTQAVLLLCGTLGGKTNARPLTPAQYNGLVTGLVKLGKRPGDLLRDESLFVAVCLAQEENRHLKEPATPERVKALLARGMSLSLALDKWSAYGIRPVGRGDTLYPKRMKEHLKGAAPAVIYCAGNADLLAGGGMAFVGSRDLSDDAAEVIRKVVRECVSKGLPVVSGGARGADQTSMREAFENGGSVIGALPGDLCKACLEPGNREALAGGRALLFSVADPEAGFSGYAAMDRNKYIYAMADMAFVAQSGCGPKSGTWSGAAEELKREKHRPVFVYLPQQPSEGCVDLVKKGAVAWQMDKTVEENRAEVKTQEKKPSYQGDLFSGISAAEVVKPYADKASKFGADVQTKKTTVVETVETTPYALVKNWLVDFLSVPRDEKDVKKRLAKDFDLVTAQIKHWLEKLEVEGVLVRKEYPKGKKGKVVMCEKGPNA